MVALKHLTCHHRTGEPVNVHCNKKSTITWDREIQKPSINQIRFCNITQTAMRTTVDATLPVMNQKAVPCIKYKIVFLHRTCLTLHQRSYLKMWRMNVTWTCLMSLVSLSWKTSFTINLSFSAKLRLLANKVKKSWQESRI